MASRDFFAYIIIVSFIILTIAPYAMAQVTQPTDLRLIDVPSSLQAGGITYKIVAQAQLNGSMLMVDGIRVNMTSGNATILPASASVLTDNMGRATFNVVTTNYTGNVTLTLTVAGTNVTLNKTLTVLGIGNIMGFVTDDTNRPVTAATVTIYGWDGSKKGEVLNITGNPLVSSSGIFNFTEVPSGTYYIEAVGDNLSGYIIYTVNNGYQEINIPTAGTFVPTPMVTPTAVPSASPTVTPSPAAGSDKQATGIILAAIIIAAILLAVAIAYRLLLKNK